MNRSMVFAMMFAVVGLLFCGMPAKSYAAKAVGMTCQQRFEHYDINHTGKVTLPDYEMGYANGQYVGTVPMPTSPPAFIEFDQLDHGNKGYLTESDFCANPNKA
jgi:hypothetical protein